ncbi:MAG TPA: hypothetical protein ENJ95_19280 [Bacteroidetes bacterium]|nr:hypothetical protein [Bacteroidota bacterium]
MKYVHENIPEYETKIRLDLINVFGRSVNLGDNFEFVFSDDQDNIYLINTDNGYDPYVKIVATKIENIFGDIDFDNLPNTSYHFEFPKKIKRIEDIIDKSRVVTLTMERDFHNYVPDYERLVRDAITASNVNINFIGFNQIKFESKNGIQNVILTINNNKHHIQINTSYIFDFNISKEINPKLKESGINMAFHIIQEEDWEELYGAVFLNEKELKKFKKEKMIRSAF